MRALIYYVATSLDGFIADPDGGFDRFPMGDHVEAFFARLPSFGAVLMGRATYAVGLEQGVTSPYAMIPRQVVYSSSMAASPDPAVELVRGDAVAHVAALKAEDGAPIWLCGGARLAGSLARAGLIDELWLKQSPLLLGAGIPLFAGGLQPAALRLLDSRRFDSGVLESRYSVTADGAP